VPNLILEIEEISLFGSIGLLSPISGDSDNGFWVIAVYGQQYSHGDHFFPFNMQVNSFSGMGLGYHVGCRSPWVDDEIQIVPSLDATKGVQIPYKPSPFACCHFDPPDWSYHC
jgi:hypothetical protein